VARAARDNRGAGRGHRERRDADFIEPGGVLGRPVRIELCDEGQALRRVEMAWKRSRIDGTIAPDQRSDRLRHEARVNDGLGTRQPARRPRADDRGASLQRHLERLAREHLARL
jgi:hypothetical protein